MTAMRNLEKHELLMVSGGVVPACVVVGSIVGTVAGVAGAVASDGIKGEDTSAGEALAAGAAGAGAGALAGATCGVGSLLAAVGGATLGQISQGILARVVDGRAY